MKKLIIRFSIYSLILFILIVFFVSLGKEPQYNTKSLIGNKLTNVQLKSLQNDKILTDKDLKKNDFTLINFWASWCGPCKIEHPYLIKLSEEKNLKIIGVNFKDKKDNALDFLKTLGNPYDYLAEDNSGKQSIFFGVYGIPESILMSEKLEVKKKFIGPISERDFKDIKKFIREK
jgi:cytochrome c biogenesis protein CcmG/thiol:disulfide interchange protein DsbE